MSADPEIGVDVIRRPGRPRHGVVGGAIIAVIGILGYTVVPIPSDPTPSPFILDRLFSAGFLFFERPIRHHVAFTFAPSIVVSAAVFYRRGDGGTKQEDLEVFKYLVGVPVALIFVAASVTGFFWAMLLGVLIGLVFAVAIALAIIPTVGAGSVVGYLIASGARRIIGWAEV